MKALDIVVTPEGSIGVIACTVDGGTRASIEYIHGLNERPEHNAWWHVKELRVVDSIPRILAKAMCCRDTNSHKDVEKFFHT